MALLATENHPPENLTCTLHIRRPEQVQVVWEKGCLPFAETG